VPVGGAVAAKDSSGAPIIVAQPTAGKAVAFSAICTHMGCQVAPAGKQLNCPCHGSQYDATSGAVLHGPATKPLPPVAVKVENGQVVAG
jgi:Rieske Fe-S protein